MPITMEDRMERAEKQIGEFLWLVKALAPPAVKLETDILSLRALVERELGTMNRQLHEMSGRLDQMDGRLDQMDGRFDQMSARLDQMDQRLGSVESHLTSLEEKVGQILQILQKSS
jgi:chromosome segregation ATPase